MNLNYNRDNKKNTENMTKNDIRSHFQENDHLLCLTCGSKLNKTTKLSALVKHMQSKKNHNTTFECAICNIKFSDESEFKQHNLDIHQENKVFKCAVVLKKVSL